MQLFKKIGMVFLMIFGALTIIVMLFGTGDDKNEMPIQDGASGSPVVETEVATVVPEEVEPEIEAVYRDKKLEVIEMPTVIEDSFMSYITGKAVNISGKEMSYAQISITLYDEDGAQIGTAIDNINNLEADGVWKFKAMALEDFASWKISDFTTW